MQLTVDMEVAEGIVSTKYKKVIFPFCVVNFARSEEMIVFETEFKKAIEELK